MWIYLITYRSERDEDRLPSGHSHHGRVTVKKWLKKHHLKMCHVTVMYIHIHVHVHADVLATTMHSHPYYTYYTYYTGSFVEVQ